MKHVVELQYTNPSHEHVSLRRRVETVNRVVEAQSEEEALNRAANQQRALGFRIQSANIIEQKVEESKTEVLSEDVELDEGKYASTIAAIASAAYQPKVGDKIRTRRGGQIPGEVTKVTDTHVHFKHPEGKTYKTSISNVMREEVEIEQKVEESKTEVLSEDVELDEGKVAKALAVGAMSLASMGAKAHTDTTKSVAQLAQERPALAQRLHDIGASGQVPASDKRAAELQRKQDQEMPASERRAKELKKEEVEQVDESHKVGDLVSYFHKGLGDHVYGEVQSVADDHITMKSAGKTWKVPLHLVHKANKNSVPKYRYEQVEQVDEGSKRMSAAVKLQRAFDREKVSSDASRKRGEEMLAQARAEYAKKQAAKTNEEVEQIDEISPGLARKAAAASQVKAIEFSDYSGLSNLHNKEGKKEANRLNRKSDKAMDYIGKRQGQKGVDKVNRMVTRVVGEEAEQVDEANMRFDPEAAARPKSSDVKNFLNRDKNARAGAASKKYIRRMTKLGGLGPNQTKKDTEKHMKDYFEEVEISEASKEGKSVMYGMRASMKAMDLRHGVDSDKRDSGYKMSPAVRAAQAKSDALSKVEKPVQAGTLAALKRRAMKKEEVESVDEGVISAVKNAQAKWKTAHRAVYGKDPSLKSMTVGAIARLAGAKASTARAVGAAVGGKPVSAQQQAAAKARAGKVGMAKMRNEEKHEGDDVNANVKGKKAAEKMTKKAAEVRKAKIQGSVNKINMEPTIDLNKKAEK